MAARISAQEARRLVTTGQALLVCAYDDDQKWKDSDVAGSMPLSRFRTQLETTPKTRGIIFYCG